VDAVFEKYIRTIVGEADYNNIRERARKKMMKEFNSSR
jgi:hypothetical protein